MAGAALVHTRALHSSRLIAPRGPRLAPPPLLTHWLRYRGAYIKVRAVPVTGDLSLTKPGQSCPRKVK